MQSVGPTRRTEVVVSASAVLAAAAGSHLLWVNLFK
jgi:hypothetical protein